VDNVRDNIIKIVKDTCTSAAIKNNEDYDKQLKDLGVDSLDFSGILLALEEKYKIRIPDEDMGKLATINSITKYINKS